MPHCSFLLPCWVFTINLLPLWQLILFFFGLKTLLSCSLTGSNNNSLSATDDKYSKCKCNFLFKMGKIIFPTNKFNINKVIFLLKTTPTFHCSQKTKKWSHHSSVTVCDVKSLGHTLSSKFSISELISIPSSSILLRISGTGLPAVI